LYDDWSFPLSENQPSEKSRIAKLIDHTVLKPETVREDVLRICREALEYRFASVCVNPCWVPDVARELSGSDVKVCTVIAFPFGAAATENKACETAIAIRMGAQEIDMVLNIGALRSGNLDVVRRDIAAVVEESRRTGALVKVILETALLNNEQKLAACRLSKEAGADFVKTSTGFASAGATVEDIALMRNAVGPGMGVKASGGVRTLEDLRKMVAAGASRIGASASVQIVNAAGS
jgi:deoxyribose-phosphate aldolase